MSQIKTNQFLELALGQMPRLLGQLNRNVSSRSFGSFDRAYWHYRTNDISCARYQEAVYTLALLYFSDFEGNEYYRDEKLLEWIRVSLRFSVSLQRKNGSFDEWYINEGSYVATAFVTAALSQTMLLLKKNNVVIEEESSVVNVLERAAHFLVSHEEKTVMNQVSGAIYAIAAVGRISENNKLNAQAELLLNNFISEQNTEGWWSEYGGPDIGYLTLTISYLEKYQELHETEKISAVISKAKSFVEAFIAPDKTAGGEYMSRNTEYIVPSKTLPYVGAVTPANLDDRYLCYILYNWLETGLRVSPLMVVPTESEIFFAESRSLRFSNPSYFLVAGGIKGGSFRIYAGDRVYYDSGLEIVDSKKSKSLSAGILDVNNKVTFEKGKFHVSGAMKRIKEPLLKTKIAIAFKTWQFLFGRISFFQKLIKDFLRPRMVSYSGSVDVSFERHIAYTSNTVIVTDVVHGKVPKEAVLLGLKSAYSAVPSSKYATVSEVSSRRLVPRWEETQEGETRTIKRTFTFN